MTNIKIDGKDYEYENLSDKSKSQLNKIKYVQKEIAKLKANLNVLQTAESVYYSDLLKEVNSSD